MRPPLRTSIVSYLFLLASAGCGNIPDDPFPRSEASARSRPETLPAELAATEAYPEPQVLRAAASRIRAGKTMPFSAARRCWESEAARPAVREACALAWSADPAEGASLDDELLREGPASRALALAALRREPLLRKASFPQLLRLLAPLGGEPSWVRIRPLLAWLELHPGPSFREREQIWAAAGFGPGVALPVSVELAWKLGERLGPPWNSWVLSKFCAFEQEPMALVRCLRALSAIAAPAEGPPFPGEMKRHLEGSEAWALFSRSFPERAILLGRHRR